MKDSLTTGGQAGIGGQGQSPGEHWVCLWQRMSFRSQRSSSPPEAGESGERNKEEETLVEINRKMKRALEEHS